MYICPQVILSLTNHGCFANVPPPEMPTVLTARRPSRSAGAPVERSLKKKRTEITNRSRLTMFNQQIWEYDK